MIEVIGEDIRSCGVNKKMIKKRKIMMAEHLHQIEMKTKKIIIVYDDIFPVISIAQAFEH